jgi:methyltransferase
MFSRLFHTLQSYVVLQRAVELLVAARNRRWALEQGAREEGADHYWLFFPLHVGWYVAQHAEARRRRRLGAAWPLWLTLYLLAQILRYWTIGTLGRRWNTRILVFDDRPPVRGGPFRFLRHPNYVAVVLELLSLPLIFGAWKSGLAASVANAWILLKIRIPAEERALDTAGGGET